MVVQNKRFIRLLLIEMKEIKEMKNEIRNDEKSDG